MFNALFETNFVKHKEKLMSENHIQLLDQEIQKQIDRCVTSFNFEADEHILNDLRKALQYKLEERSPEEIKNTYLKNLEIPQIVLFDILANRFPLVMNAQRIVNNVILEKSTSHESITILDLGIGRGVQIKKILSSLNQLKEIKEVTVIGVEIYHDALEYTTSLMHEIKKELNYLLTFLPINNAVENIDAKSLKSMIPSSSSCLLVNASLTLHHIQAENDRLALFQKLKTLNPDLLTIIEPNTDCFTDNFDQRLLNVYEHFSALYRFINTLELLPKEKKGLKQFFSTELFDAVALPNAHRFEKYNRSEAWIKTAQQAGFHPYNLTNALQEINIKNIAIAVNPPGYINFSFDKINILGTLGLY